MKTYLEVVGKQTILNFLFAGKCTAVFGTDDPLNPKKTHYTFFISKDKAHRNKWSVYCNNVYVASVYSVSPDHFVEDGYSISKSSAAEAANMAYTFHYFIHHIVKGTLPEQFHVYHTGICGRCGRELTDPESIKAGIGPTCRNK